ncbi:MULTISPECIES: hypothetical protein [unclassified Demequina]|nr:MULTISPECIES: hypothetical protein [unclassified Demequina]
MSEWSWVAVGFTVTYGSLIAYFLLMQRRRVAVRRQLKRLR